MRTTPSFLGIVYAIMGMLFTSLAINSVEETIWNFTTLLLTIVATFDFIIAIRYLSFKRKTNNG
jgi:hypothetical protein